MGKIVMFPKKISEPKGKVVKPSVLVGKGQSYITINIKESLSKYIRLGLDRHIAELSNVPECLLMLSELLDESIERLEERRESQ